MNKMNEIISKVIVDTNFRTEFLNDPIKATEKFDLSDNEQAQLRAIDLNELTQVNTELEERLSKSFINLPSIDKGEDAEHTSHGSGSAHNSTSHSSW